MAPKSLDQNVGMVFISLSATTAVWDTRLKTIQNNSETW